MKEDFLHFIWRYRLYSPNLITSDGRMVQIQKTGEHNTDAGPDFLNAMVNIAGTLWAGHVEIHVNAGDWSRHGHHKDPAYDNVVLHVVYADDAIVHNTRGEVLPTISLQGRIPMTTMQRYAKLSLKQKDIACAVFLPDVNRLVVQSMLERCAAEKLQQKTESLLQLYRLLHADPDSLAYQVLARAIGFRINADAFQLFTRMLPYSVLRKLRDNPAGVLAVVLGCAGVINMLDERIGKEKIDAEWRYWQKVLNIRPMEPHLWRYARTRPANHPDRRLMQFAAMLCNSDALFASLAPKGSVTGMRKILLQLIEVPPEWKEFGITGDDLHMGSDTIDLLIVNVVVPLMALAHRLGIAEYSGLDGLEAILPEDNRIIRSWQSKGVRIDNALQSQGAIQLFHRYCRFQRCLSCSIAVNVLQDKA